MKPAALRSVYRAAVLAASCFMQVAWCADTSTRATAKTPAAREAVIRSSAEEIISSVHSRRTPYLLRDNERILIIDFPTVREQAAMFARIVLFVERHGTPKTRVMTHAEIQQWLKLHSQKIEILTVGNNVRASQLAHFFNTAFRQKEALTADEQWLHDWLLDIGVLRKADAILAAGEPESVVLTLPQVSFVPGCPACAVLPAHRKAIFEHELAHGRFATDIAYREYVLSFWNNQLDDKLRDTFIRFLRKRGYNDADPELLANEMQAFLMHTPDPSMFNAAAAGMTEVELEDLRKRFAQQAQAKD